MRAVVYRGERDVRVEDVPEPELVAPDDAIVRVRKAAICGSDLHFFHGRVPGVFEGTVVGHEYVGTVVAVGDAVTRFRTGDEVVGSFQIACGTCDPCRKGRFNLCDDLGVLGYGIFVGDLAGAQAEYVRVPHADVNLLTVPSGLSPEQALFAGDILTTGWYAAGIAPVHEGDDVVVVGAGPVGTFAATAARAMGAGRVVAVDLVPARLELAASLGAVPVNSAERAPAVAVEDILGGMADVVIETVGLPPALDTAIDCVRAGGTVSVIGVHTEFQHPLPLANLFTRNVTLRFGGSCNVQGWWERALAAIAAGQADPTVIVTHRLPLDDAAEGYRLFDSKEAMKVVLEVSD
ncbi:MAG TPA: alcohol dehydrogenase catalytic domain-containing protein [Mycobacteriales bacterium]|jgi:threonine dehydrogenase-like Zn-dependent dehydrogenase|nr:alcohol dehydrogenase catalytic domain-containing protein [Mycobacteriales bacterium]